MFLECLSGDAALELMFSVAISSDLRYDCQRLQTKIVMAHAIAGLRIKRSEDMQLLKRLWGGEMSVKMPKAEA